MTNARFIQISVAALTDDPYLSVYALDDTGAVWLYHGPNDWGDSVGWEPLAQNRLKSTIRDSEIPKNTG